jgi:aminoglycoside phosphotransferase (APT) family kinase protein
MIADHLASDELARLETYLSRERGASVQVIAHSRLHGGASRQTFTLDVTVDGAAEALILRRDPPDSLIDTDRAVEFAAYRTFAGTSVPVPEALHLCEDQSVLGAPFFVMRKIPVGAAASPFQIAPYAPHESELGRQFFTHLGTIAAADAAGSPLARVVDRPTPNDAWRVALDHWQKVAEADAQEPQPILAAAFRRLRAHPPAPAQKIAIVHGDYRSGNFLHDGEGQISAILDWEMAHLGDPFEDLAWALDPLWSHFQPDSGAGLIGRGEAIALWERASFCRFDPAAFQWWSLFASVKGMAIWLSAARAFAGGQNPDPVLAFSGWYCARRHDDILAARLTAGARGALP